MQTSARHTLIGEALAHALHDTWYGVAPVLLASVSSSLRLTNADIGLIILVYQAVSSLTQPIFGRLCERYGGRLFAVGSIVWTALLFTGTLFANEKWLLTLLIALAGLGSGAFHPQGTANSTAAGGARRGATATSMFFFGGTLGTALLGAALGGFLIAQFGRQSLVAISALNISLALLVVRRLVPKAMTPTVSIAGAPSAQGKEKGGGVWMFVAVLLAAIALRALSQQTITTYVPKFLQDSGISPAIYGATLSMFLGAVAAGGVVWAYAADRVGFRVILVGSLVATAGLLLAFTRLQGTLSVLSLVAAGFFLGPSHTLLLVSGQRRFPQRMAMISGILLGFGFVSGAIGTWLLGVLADSIGLARVLSLLPVIVLANALFALLAVGRSAPARTEVGAPDPAVPAVVASTGANES